MRTAEPGFRFGREQRGDLTGWSVRGFRYPIWLQVAKRPDGRLSCVELRIDGDPEVTAKGLREIRLGAVLDTLAVLLSRHGAVPPESPNLLPIAEAAWYEGESEQLLGELEARPRRTVLTDELLGNVAAAYRAELIVNPRSPVESLAQRLHMSTDTLRRQLRLARQRQKLGPAIPGKAGERPPRRKRL